MEFVSQLDEIFFSLSAQGFLGKKNQEQAELVSSTDFKAETVLSRWGRRRRKGSRMYLILAAIWILLMSAWTFVMVRQTEGRYLCQTLQVQFEDDFVPSLGAFSGLYDIQEGRVGAFTGDRVRYVDRQSGKALFAYCPEMEAWTFNYAEDGHFPDPCDDWVGKYQKQQNIAISSCLAVSLTNDFPFSLLFQLTRMTQRHLIF